MQIDFLLESLAQSGGHHVCLNYAQYLANHGHAVRVLTCAMKGVVRPDITVPVEQVDRGAIAELCTAEATVFSVHDFVGPLLSAGHTVPVLLCQGAIWEDRLTKIEATENRPVKDPVSWVRKKLRLRRLRRKLAEIDRAYKQPVPMIVVSDSLQRKVRQRYGGEVYLVRNGIDHRIFRPAESPRPAGGTPTVLSVGSSGLKVKRIGDLLEAVGRLKQVGSPLPGVRLVRLAPDEMPETERRAGVTDQYFTKVWAEELGNLYRGADVLVACSDRAEGFGLPPIEAMACGTPVVLTRIDAFCSYDQPTDYARFVDVGDVDELARAIVEVLTDGDLRERLIRRGYEVAAKYDLFEACRQFEQTLTTIVGQGK